MTVLGFGSSLFYVKSSSLVLIGSYTGLGQFSWVGTHSIQGFLHELGAVYSLIGPWVPGWCQVALDIGWG